MPIQRIPSRQLDLGVAGFFEVFAEDPPANQVSVRRGTYHMGGLSVKQNALFPADETSTGFSVVSGGSQRYDLVVVDAAGTLQIIPGYEVTLATAAFQGAPGWTGTNPGVQVPDNVFPVAYVLVDETSTVLVTEADITPLSAIPLSRDYDGYLVDKGFLGSAPTGDNDVVTTLFSADTRISAAGATVPDSGGGTTQTGIVTSAPLNYVHITNHLNDEIVHVSGARVYGRLTEAGGVWTLDYRYIGPAGAEVEFATGGESISNAADVPITPIDIRLVGTPRVYSRNDPARPLFDSNVSRLSDQLVGDIPTATVSVQGKVIAAANLPSSPPQAGSVNRILNNSVLLAGGPWNTLNDLGGGWSNAGSGVAEKAAPAANFGKAVQQWRATPLQTVLTCSTNTPFDDTIPQIGEGTQVFLIGSIVPLSTSNFLVFEFSCMIGYGINAPTAALHQDAVADALAANGINFTGGAGSGQSILALDFWKQVASLSAQSYQIRVGVPTGTAYINGDPTGTQLYGGRASASFVITEYEPN